jgi:hypothetical protein
LQGLLIKAHACAQVWVHEQGDGRLDIVDGKQRITSLLSFLDGTFPRNHLHFTLEGLETLETLNGRARAELSAREQQSILDYPLSLRILGQHSGAAGLEHALCMARTAVGTCGCVKQQSQPQQSSRMRRLQGGV